MSEIAYVYLHGFASSAGSAKGVFLRDAFAPLGIEVALPELNVPTFETMTYSTILTELDRLDRERRPAAWRVVGSSMGGYLAARWAELRPDRVERLALLCPGFDLEARWPKYVGEAGMRAWESRGFLDVADHAEARRKLHWGFVEDAREHPAYPDVPHATLVIHGTRDDVVPVDFSRRWVGGRATARLIEVDDDHRLIASRPRIFDELVRFFDVG